MKSAMGVSCGLLLLALISGGAVTWAQASSAAAPAPAPAPQPWQSGGVASADNFLFTGALVNAIPIEVPPGIGGVEPELTLQYRSGAPATWVGVGWELSVGIIERSDKNGFPKFNDSDTFRATLNGQSLELVRIPDGSYRAKIEGAFRKFVFQNDQWTVYDKKGTRYFFGRTNQSKVPGAGGTLKWALDRIEDTNTNYLTVSYLSPPNPNEILYGGNVSAGRTPDRKIMFTQGNTLQWVKTYVGTSLASAYELVYSTSANTFRQLLREVRRYGPDSVTRFPTTSLQYQGSDTGQATTGTSIPGDWSNEFIKIAVGDFNGDGIDDYLELRESPFPSSAPRTTGSSVYLSDGQGHFQRAGDIPGIVYTSNPNRVVSNALVTGDFNGDGKTDLIVFRPYDGFPADPGNVYLSNGDGTFTNFGRHPVLPPAQGQYDGRPYAGDFNGDGLTDLLIVRMFDTSASAYIYLSNGDGTFRQAGTLPFLNLGNSSGYSGVTAVVADLNGDGRSDIAIQRHSVPTQSAIYYTNADGTFSNQGPITRFGYGNVTYDARVDLVMAADVDGDGKSDLIIWPSTGWSYCPPRGVCTPFFVGLEAHLASGGSMQISDPGVYTTTKSIAPGDFNGDGAADLMVYGDNGCRIYLGSAVPNQPVNSVPCPSRSWASDDRFFMADFNGDGRSDLFVFRAHVANQGGSLYATTGDAPDLLASITNGIGGTSVVTYGLSRNFPNRYLPFVLPIVTRIRQDNGRCSTSGGCTDVTYAYEGGYYDRFSKEFLGFSKVTTTDAMGNRTESYFHQDRDSGNNSVPFNALKGRQHRTTKAAASGTLLAQTDSEWEAPLVWTNVYFPRPKRVTDKTTDVTPVLQTEIEFQYDDAASGGNVGNILKRIYKGDLSITGDEHTESFEYAANLDKYVVGLPRRFTLLSATGATVTDTMLYYDGSAVLGAIDRGNLTEQRRWLDKPTARWISSTTQVNAFGQVTLQTDPRGAATTTVYDGNQFPSKVTNAAGHSVETTTDPATGNITSRKDANLQLTAYRYDQLGRVARIVGPLDSETYPSVEFDYHDALLGNPAQQFTERRERLRHGDAAYVWSKEYFDGVGQVYRAEKKTVGNQSTIIETVFNTLGQVVQTSVPRLAAAPTTVWVERQYDALGRVTKVQNPDGTSTTTSYQGRTITVRDANGQVHSSVGDAYGRIIRRYEPSMANPTEYTYDARGLVLTSLDPQRRTTNVTFDSLGRKLTILDPNAGLWSYQYDDNGNMVEQADARSVRIGLKYDALNRVTEKKLVSDAKAVTGQAAGTILASYSYDAAGQAFSKGRLTSVSHPSGTTQFFHDALGRVSRQTKTIDGAPYDVETAYNAQNRITQLKYPNGTIVRYVYDDAGFLLKVTNDTGTTEYASFGQYDAFGRPLAWQQAGGRATTTYAYDANAQRLTDLTITLATLSAGTPVPEAWRLRYDYDPLGNITQIGAGTPLAPKVTAAYDSVGRLLNARGAYFGEQRFTYDDLGNILQRNGTTYSFQDPAHPHAVTMEVQPGTNGGLPTVIRYTYDASGNRIAKSSGWTAWSYRYDAEGRLSQVTKDRGVLANYSYDSEGGRTKAVSVVGTTRYVGRLFETRPDGTQVVHVMAGQLAICDIISGGGSTTKTRYLHQDQLGSIWLVSDASGLRMEHTEYDPFGAMVLLEGTAEPHNGFTNQTRDFETGMYYFNARYYDPLLARFASADSLVPAAFDPQALNRYAYVRNSPLNLTDPTGHGWFKNFFRKPLNTIGFVAQVLGGPMGVIAGAGLLSRSAEGRQLVSGEIIAGTVAFSAICGGCGGWSAVAGELQGAYQATKTGQNILSATLQGGIIGGARGAASNLVTAAQVNPLIEIIAKAHIGGVFGTISGGSYGRDFLFSAVTTSANLAYKALLGYAPNAAPSHGVPHAAGDTFSGRYEGIVPPEAEDTVGYNAQLTHTWWKDIGTQGGPVTHQLSLVPTINSFSKVHDLLMNTLSNNIRFEGLSWAIVNFGSMAPAMVFSDLALMGQ